MIAHTGSGPASPPPTTGPERSRGTTTLFCCGRRRAPRPVDTTPAILSIKLRAPVRSVKQEIVCELGGQILGRKTWTDTNNVTIQFEVPHRLIKAATVLKIRNVSEQLVWEEPANQVEPRRRNDILVDSVTLRYKTLLTGPTTRQPQIVYDVLVPRAKGPMGLRFINTGGQRGRFYDVSRRSWLDGTVVDCPPNRKRRIVAVNDDGYFQPASVSKWSTRDLRTLTDGADWLCIALERFSGLVEPLADLRERQGLKTLIVTDREIYDTYNGGRFSPETIQTFLASALAAWKKKPRFVLLVGDADRDVNWKSKRAVLPAKQVTTYFNGQTASDAALLPAGAENVAIGRLPARRDDEVLKMVRRIIEYETETPAGNWNRRLNFIASEGRFGPMVDTLLENYARKTLTEIIPASYDVTMTYASRQSAYLYPPTEFNNKVIDRFNEGSLVYTYMGHGYRQGFDRLRIGNERFPHFRDQRYCPDRLRQCTASDDDHCLQHSALRQPGRGLYRRAAHALSQRPHRSDRLHQDLSPLLQLSSQQGTAEGGCSQTRTNRSARSWSNLRTAWSATGRRIRSRSWRSTSSESSMSTASCATTVTCTSSSAIRPRGCCARRRASRSRLRTKRLPAARSMWLPSSPARGRRTSPSRLSHGATRSSSPMLPVDPAAADTEELIKTNYQAANQKKVAGAVGTTRDGRCTATIKVPSNIPAGPYFIKAFASDGRRSWAGSAPIAIEVEEKK